MQPAAGGLSLHLLATCHFSAVRRELKKACRDKVCLIFFPAFHMQWDRLVASRCVYLLEKEKKKDQIVIYVTSAYTVSFIGEICFFLLMEK